MGFLTARVGELPLTLSTASDVAKPSVEQIVDTLGSHVHINFADFAHEDDKGAGVVTDVRVRWSVDPSLCYVSVTLGISEECAAYVDAYPYATLQWTFDDDGVRDVRVSLASTSLFRGATKLA